MKPLDKEQLDWVRESCGEIYWYGFDNGKKQNEELATDIIDQYFPLPESEMVPMERVRPLIEYLQMMGVDYNDKTALSLIKQWEESQ